MEKYYKVGVFGISTKDRRVKGMHVIRAESEEAAIGIGIFLIAIFFICLAFYHFFLKNYL